MHFLEALVHAAQCLLGNCTVYDVMQEDRKLETLQQVLALAPAYQIMLVNEVEQARYETAVVPCGVWHTRFQMAGLVFERVAVVVRLLLARLVGALAVPWIIAVRAP